MILYPPGVWYSVSGWPRLKCDKCGAETDGEKVVFGKGGALLMVVTPPTWAAKMGLDPESGLIVQTGDIRCDKCLPEEKRQQSERN